MNLSANDITLFLIGISVMLFFARVFGEVSRALKQPIVIGEIIAGIVLGPTIFGMLFPDIFNSLFTSSKNISIAYDGLTTLAVIMLLLVSGLEVDLSVVLKQGKTAIITSFMGVFFPFTVGFAAAYLFPESLGIVNIEQRLVFSLFVGTALSITALPVVAKTLMDLNIFKTEIGTVIIASAMVNDLIGWMIFSIILSMIGTAQHGLSFGSTVGLTFLFVGFSLIIGRKLINHILPVIQTKTSFPGGVINFILILGFLGAAFTEYIGIHAIFGSFIIGIAVGDSAHLKEHTKEIIHQFITNIFAPLFFVSIGLRVNFIAHFDIVIVLVFLILAFAGKVIGCGLGAYLGGMKKDDALAVGFGMNSRGAMEIILGILAYDFGLINEKVFVALVIMALFTSISSAPLMSIFLNRVKNFKGLLNPKLIFISDAINKKTLISELAQKVSEIIKIDKEIIISEVLKREEIMPTGIANSLALPHAKIKISKPIVAIALLKNEIDFEAADSIPSKIVVLLLTPENDNELQLKLLSDIAKTFGDKSKVDDLLSDISPNSVYSKLQKF
jgi:Kef-type K+ transport system membrane component KefB/mannitol/fructose-specific phosphotransferase system IIA component (Ntr-type)